MKGGYPSYRRDREERPNAPLQDAVHAMLAWLARTDTLDSPSLMAQLAECGLGESVAWVTRRDGLCAAAASEAQPREALDGFWHFFGLLRGEAELIADRADAERMLAETNDPIVQQRLIRLSEALAVLRGGDEAADAGHAP